MKWKDANGGESPEPEKSDPYYEDNGYSSFKESGLKKAAILSGNPVRYLYWGLGIVVVAGVVLLVNLLFSNIYEPVDLAYIRELEQKIGQLEQRLGKYDGMDEKVTHIWEQAKAFETFKARFDRSEASMSLRMDHLAMSLDTLQKRTDTTLQKIDKLEKASTAKAVQARRRPTKKTATIKTHTVVAGDTLFSISRRYNLSVDELKSMNQLTEDAVIHVGQTLTVRSLTN